MNIRTIGIYIGHILRIEGALMIPPLLIALYYHEVAATRGFLIALPILALGFVLSGLKNNDSRIKAKEGFLIVAIS